jgi:hypothetical protein
VQWNGGNAASGCRSSLATLTSARGASGAIVHHFECVANIRKGYLIVRMSEYTNYQTWAFNQSSA